MEKIAEKKAEVARIVPARIGYDQEYWRNYWNTYWEIFYKEMNKMLYREFFGEEEEGMTPEEEWDWF